MSNVITERIAEYDVQEFIEFEIKDYLNNIPEFLERYEHYILEDLRQDRKLKAKRSYRVYYRRCSLARRQSWWICL